MISIMFSDEGFSIRYHSRTRQKRIGSVAQLSPAERSFRDLALSIDITTRHFVALGWVFWDGGSLKILNN